MFVTPMSKKIEIIYVEVLAGGVTIHHGCTWYSYGINNSKNHRRAYCSSLRAL